MAITDWIPEIHSKRVVSLLDKIQTAVPIVNRAYEGDIRQEGDVVNILTAGDVTVSAYTGADISNQTLSPTKTAMSIDQQYAFNYRVPRVENVQSAADLDNAHEERAVRNLSLKADTYIYGLHADAGANSQESGSPWTLGTDGSGVPALYASLVRQQAKNDVPTDNLCLVGPPELAEAIHLYFGTRDTGLSDGVVTNGFMGRFFGIDTVISNNLTTEAGTPNIIHGLCFPKNDGIAYASQIMEMKRESLENNFGHNVLGLFVFGAKVYRPSVVVDVELDATLLA